MTKTLIDIDDRQLARAQRSLGTATKRDTVNAALTQVVALAARRRDLDRFRADAFADLRDPDVTSAAWLR
jgi:Arc/MetJ family transcription regulator